MVIKNPGYPTYRHSILASISVFLSAFLLLCAPVLLAQTHEGSEVKPQEAAVHSDTAHSAANGHNAEAAEHEDVSKLTPAQEMMRILSHKVENTPYIHEYPFPKLSLPTNWIVSIGGTSINMSPNRHIVYMWFAVLLTVLLTWLAARQNKRNVVPRGYGNMIESMIVFVRDEVAMPFLGKDTHRFLPLLLTFFFFITTMNLVGLLPFGATATGNINITAALALITFSFMILSGMRSNGTFGFWKGIVPHGVPTALVPLMFLIEVIGLLTKPFALAIRLFANMLSGGLVIGAFYALIFGMDTLLIAPVSIAFLLFMSLLKIFVCLLQAYIFTMLSAFFIGMSVHQEH